MNEQIMNELEKKLNTLTLNNITFEEFIDYKIIRKIYEALNNIKGYPYPTTIEGWISLLHIFSSCTIKKNERRPDGILDGEYLFDIQTVIARLLDTRVLVKINKTYHIGLDSVFKPRGKKRTIPDYFIQNKKKRKMI